MPIAAALTVAPDDLAALRQLADARQAPAVLVQRAKILLLTAECVIESVIPLKAVAPFESGRGYYPQTSWAVSTIRRSLATCSS